MTDFLCYYPDGSDQFYGVIDARRNRGKLAYYALQSMGWLFDGIENAPDNLCVFRPPNRQHFGSLLPFRVESCALRRRGKPVFACWLPEHCDLTPPPLSGRLLMQAEREEMPRDPVIIDPIRRNVWKIDPSRFVPEDDGVSFFGGRLIDNFPVTDYPLFVTDASVFDDL